MITLPDFTPGDAVVASTAISALAAHAVGPHVPQLLRELSAALVHAAGEASRGADRGPDWDGPEDPVDAAEDTVVDAALAWARADREANRRADEMAVAVRTQEEATREPAIRIVNGQSVAVGAPKQRQAVELAIRALDLATEAEQSALRRMHDAARQLELVEREDADADAQTTS